MNHDQIYGQLSSEKLIPNSIERCQSNSVLSHEPEPDRETSTKVRLIRSLSAPLLRSMIRSDHEPVPKPESESESESESDRERERRRELGTEEPILGPESFRRFRSIGSDDSVTQDDELIITPHSSQHPNLIRHPSPGPSHPSHHSRSSNLLSCSLPASISRTPTQEYVTHELLRLTLPLREGLLSRERLLPSTRIKQIGVGGRGKRLGDSIGSSGSGQTRPRFSDDRSIETSSDLVPLVIPRPIRAWQAEQT